MRVGPVGQRGVANRPPHGPRSASLPAVPLEAPIDGSIVQAGRSHLHSKLSTNNGTMSAGIASRRIAMQQNKKQLGEKSYKKNWRSKNVLVSNTFRESIVSSFIIGN